MCYDAASFAVEIELPFSDDDVRDVDSACACPRRCGSVSGFLTMFHNPFLCTAITIGKEVSVSSWFVILRNVV